MDIYLKFRSDLLVERDNELGLLPDTSPDSRLYPDKPPDLGSGGSLLPKLVDADVLVRYPYDESGSDWSNLAAS